VRLKAVYGRVLAVVALFVGFVILGGRDELQHNAVAASFIDLPVVN
jgi:hypothetical protein